MSDRDEETPNDRMRGRVGASRFTVWLLLGASRRLVVVALTVSLFVAFVALGALDPVGLPAAMASGDPIEALFQALLTAIVTGVTLVVTIDQLVLSQELGAVGDQRERMEDAMAFRREVEDVLDEPVAPAEPSAFLRALVAATRDRAETLGDAAADGVEADRRERIDAYVDDLTEHATSVGDRLSGARFGTFAVVSAALDFNYSWKLYEARRLRAEVDDGGAVAAALDDVVEALELFGPAREHVKTLYFQWALIDLSRSVAYAALPALVVATGMVLYVDAGTFPGTTLGVDDLVWAASAAAAVSLLPFAVLLAYILRIVTVTKRTLAIGPFVLRETDRSPGNE